MLCRGRRTGRACMESHVDLVEVRRVGPVGLRAERVVQAESEYGERPGSEGCRQNKHSSKRRQCGVAAPVGLVTVVTLDALAPEVVLQQIP